MTSREIWRGEVCAEWVDYNGHMNDAAYAKVFSHGLDALMAHIGLDEIGRAEKAYTMFTLETHIKYLAESKEGQELHVTVTVLDVDAKRLHLWFEMNNEQGDVIATSEQLTMGIDQVSGRPSPFPEEVNEVISNLPLLDKENWPETANQPMGVRRKK